jgi:hypothetical protein
MTGYDAAPAALDGFDDGSDAAIRQRITELEGEIERLKHSLEENKKARQVLVLTGGALRDEVVRILSDGLRIPARWSEQSKEGFWLAAESLGEDWAFGEVRESPTGNVTREQLARVMLNRGEAGRGDDFPALLVVNTFCERSGADERDTPVPGDVIRRAVEDRIIVLRTLDLVRLLQKDQSGFAGVGEFQQALRSSGGWFEVNSALAGMLRTE